MDSFQLAFFKAISESNIGKNALISPLSLYHILSLMTNGAGGETQLEMLNALLNKSIESMNQKNKLIKDTIDKFETVESANHIFRSKEVKQKFLETIKDYKVGISHFNNIKQVNNWCNEATHGKIKEIIEDLNGDIYFLLINVIYFKGEWSIKKKTFL